MAYEIDDLTFWYHKDDGGRPDEADSTRARSSWALQDLSFQIRAGDMFGIIGPNGAGKSSLLKVLARIMPQQRGRVWLYGDDLRGLPQSDVARRLALVSQEHHPVFSFTIAEIVLMGRFPHHRHRWSLGGFGWETKEDLHVAAQAMRELDVTHLANRPITEVSGGERQRALIARALAQQPSVLLLDEPTAFLDLNHQADICRILRGLHHERGLTIVLVSHDLNLASQYCDRILLLTEGRQHSLGTPEEVICPSVLQAVYGCQVLVDPHPTSGRPRVTLPGPR